jgi:hypothetical protein
MIFSHFVEKGLQHGQRFFWKKIKIFYEKNYEIFQILANLNKFLVFFLESHYIYIVVSCKSPKYCKSPDFFYFYICLIFKYS